MARSIENIQTSIFEEKNKKVELQDLTSTKKTSIWQLWVYIMSFAIYTFELILDKHLKDVSTKLTEQKVHTARWYRSKALAFQFGFDLLADSDNFNNTDKTTEQIDASKIIKYAAVSENDDNGRLIIKVAGEKNKELSKLNEEEVFCFREYMEEIRDAGVKLTVINYDADKLFLDLKINYDPLVLSKTGMHLINTNYPVVDAIKEYMRELPFNGELVLAHLVDKLQTVEGVSIPTIMSASTSWIDANTESYAEPIGIDVKAIPISGYFKVESFDSISYVV